MDNNKEQDFLTIRDLWELFINNIWLFIGSVVIALTIAVLYLKVTPPVYQRTASVLIKDDQKSKGAYSNGIQGFDDLGIFKSKSNISNEIEIMQTPAYMEEVVRRLGLNYNYSMKINGMRRVDLYPSTPFKVEFEDDFKGKGVSLNVKFVDSTHLEITKLVVNGEKLNDCKIAVGEEIKTSQGKLRINRTEEFDDAIHTNVPFAFAKIAVKSCAYSCLGRLSIALKNKEASIVDLSFKDINPQRAEQILNTLISVYNENWIKDKNEIIYNTSEFIGSRLDIIQHELDNVDGSISDYKSKNLIPDYAAVTGLHLSQNNETKATILELNNQLSMAKYIQSYLLDATNKDQLLPANTGIQSSGIEKLISDFNVQMLKKNVLVKNSSVNNPIVKDLTTTLSALKGLVNRSVEDYIRTLNIQIQNAQNVDKLNKEYLTMNPKQAKDLISVERQQKVKEGLYLYLLQKREENELTQAFSAYNTKIVSFADGSNSPIAPKQMTIMLMALIIGIALPATYLFVIASFNTYVQSKKDLEGLNIPFIGTIPWSVRTKKRFFFLNNKQEGDQHLKVIESGNRNVVNESFRVARTNLDFITSGSEGCNVIQVISLIPSSGKSFITANLSLCMALKNHVKVLMIDLDMRRGTLSSYIKTPKLGLVNYLSGKVVDVHDVIYKRDSEWDCDVLPIGVVPPNPTELLLNGRFEAMLEILKKEYDYIFIDCPPTEIVPDARIIAPFCTASLFVIRCGNLDKRMLPDVKTIYESKKYNNMCLILNGLEYEKARYYGYGKYASAYGGYGYNSGNGYYGGK